MNVLQILPELNVGGAETGTLDLARFLVKLGHKAVVVSGGGELVRELELYGAIHYQLPVHKKSVFTILRLIPRLVEIIKKEEINIVHARSRVPAWIAYFACRKTSTVFITTCHGYYTKHPFSQVMGWGKRVIVVSNIIAQHMIEDFKVPRERIKLIPRGIDLEKFKFISPDKKRKKEEFNVGIIGRITPLKGHLYFIKAMAGVFQVVAHLKIWIVGDAPSSKKAYKKRLQTLVKKLGLWHCTEFLGTQRDISAILSNLDLLVLATTTQEAFGRVIVEAQASGVPVVATKIGGVIDIIEDGKTGLLVPAANPEAMSRAAIRIFKDIELSQNLAENAYSKAKEKYNLELMVKNTLEVYKDALTNFKILITKFTTVGDMVLSTAGIRAIREKFSRQSHKIGGGIPPEAGKDSTVTILASEASKDILLKCPYIDELLVYDFKNKDRGIGGFLRLVRVLRKKNFDIVIDLQNNRKSHILSFLSSSPNRYGYDNRKYGFLLNHRIKDTKPLIDPVAHQFRILSMLGIDSADSRLELWPTEDDRRYIDEFLNFQCLSSNQKLIGINIAASPRWETKNWSLRHIARLCEELSHRDIRVVITGTKKDLENANRLMNMVPDVRLINACGKTTVNQLACLIKKCSVYVSGDSAPLHIAASQNTPFVALFGPTDYRRHLPPAKDYVVIQKDLSCRPCYKSKCRTKKCMELITPQEVLEAINKLLSVRAK